LEGPALSGPLLSTDDTAVVPPANKTEASHWESDQKEMKTYKAPWSRSLIIVVSPEDPGDFVRELAV
jgi:hypothetical protein